MVINKQFAEAGINAMLLMDNPEESAYFLQVTDTMGTKVWKPYSNASMALFKKLK